MAVFLVWVDVAFSGVVYNSEQVSACRVLVLANFAVVQSYCMDAQQLEAARDREILERANPEEMPTLLMEHQRNQAKRVCPVDDVQLHPLVEVVHMVFHGCSHGK